MNPITRRKFLAAAACTVAATRLSAQNHEEAHVSLALPAEAEGPLMPVDFVGLSYEVEELKDPSFFSVKNTGLIRQFKAIAPRAVLRLGGNTSEFGYWKPTPSSPEPKHPKLPFVVGWPQPKYYPVTPEAVRNLLGFLEATGWTCIYGIGMGTNTPERAGAEGEFVAKTLGSRLQYFQIGNEVDLFGRHLRNPKTWGVKPYLEQWLALARAVVARVPGARLGMPDVASDVHWLTEIAAMWPSVKNPPNVTTLTHHHYVGGPPSNPEMNIHNLLSPREMAKVQKDADIATAAADKMGARVRMTEGNTCFRGGKPGVSDVFAAALWAADYSMLLASNNYTGINLHGGTRRSIANGLGGFLPGDVLLKKEGATPEQIASHPHPFYTPIAIVGSKYVLEPVAYGLKFAGVMSGSKFFKADLTSRIQAAGVDGSAYAAKLDGGETSVVILNKDATKNLHLTLDFGTGKTGAVEKETLHAPALDSREAHITQPAAAGALKNGRYRLTVPHGSGIRLIVKA